MNAFEVATAVQERVPILVFVMNDNRLGMVEIGHAAVYGRKPSYPTSPMNVAEVARALGAQALTVERPGQIQVAQLLRMRRAGPVVVDVRIDPAVRMPKKDRFAALAKPAAPPRRQLTAVN
jgi:acetolactate synthase-1/2/3 large subunit